jgi:hypothetical protein
LGNLGVVVFCLLGAVVLSPSRYEGAAVQGSTEPARQAGEAVAPSVPSQAQRAQALRTYGNLPLGFEANEGESDSRIRFLSRGGGYLLFLTPNEAVLTLKSGHAQKLERKAKGLLAASDKFVASDVLRMQLVGSNLAAGMIGVDELPGKSNYFIGNDPANWRTNIPNYRKVAEHGVYPGIDLVYYGTQRQLEYDFVVAPGADPHSIGLAFQGTNRLTIDPQGNLIASVSGGEVSFQRPIAYQEAPNGAKQPVAVRYSLTGRRKVGFVLGRHDPGRALIIDPTLSYSTYLGGSNIDGANAIAVAPDGTAFVAGGTFSSDFPTAHPLQPNAGGPYDYPQDAFVAKISADGSTLLYSTYLGGKHTDIAYGIAVDSLGNAYVVGTTDSADFPTTPTVFNTLCGGDGECGASWNPQGFIVYNGFASKLNIAGSALIYSGFIGYYEDVSANAVAVDGAGNAYVTGEVGPNIMETVPLVPPETPPPPFPIYNGFETTFAHTGTTFGGAGTDAFIIKIDASGSEFLYSSYLGGTDEDVGYGIAVDGSANAYVTGVTYSADLPVTAGALQAAYAGAGDAFLVKVNTDTTGLPSLVYSTYLGGSGLEQGNGVAIDASGNAYVAGLTTSLAGSLGFTIPGAPYQPECDLLSGVCEGDAFVAKLNPALTGPASLVYFTYLGGSRADSASGIAVDSSGDAYVTGSTSSSDFPIVGTVFQAVYGGGNADAFVTELNPTATAPLVYSTYLGGSNTDTGSGIAINPAAASSCVVVGGETICSAYVTGQTCSFDFPLANPLQPGYGGNCDAFISEVGVLQGIALNPAGLSFPTQSLGTTSQPQTVTLTNGDNAQTVSGISITGQDPADFAETNTCPPSLNPGAQCTITVTFTPTLSGVRKAGVNITDSAPGSPQVINLTGSTSLVGLSASSLAFGNQTLGQVSIPQTVTVTNNGPTPLAVTAVNASGSFAQTNNCTATPLQPTTNCEVTVTYTPVAPGASIGALTITDNAAGSPQVVLLTGTGTAGPVVTLAPTALTFASQALGTTSASQSVVLSNTGTAVLTITNIVTTGDFAQLNSCGTNLTPGANCTINVTFTPVASGSRTGSLMITDNAPGSPQAVSLSGSAADFAVSVNPTSGSVIAGNSLAYALTVTPQFGFNASVTLSCSGAPVDATCSVSPASVTPNGTSPVSATVTVKTGQRSLAPPGAGPKLNLPRLFTQVRPTWFLWLLLLVVTFSASQAMERRRRALLRLLVVAGLMLLWAGCASGGSQVNVAAGTPAGNYTLTLSATAGTITHNTTANLTVQ